MNKYQKALDNIGMTVIDSLSNGYDSPKYVKDFCYGDYNKLQELVDKASPKKPHLSEIFKDEDTETIYDEDGYINETICVCPNCGKRTIFDYEYSKRFKYCANCSQAIDWSDEE